MEPDAISTDFEIARMKEMTAAFPNAGIQGCSFHLVKNLQKKVSDLDLMSRYKTDPDFSLAARTIAALPFVPPAHLENAIAEIAVYLPQELMPVLSYFEDNHIGKVLRVRPDGSIVTKDPRFPMSSWSVYQRTMDQECRTNNC